jgi:hypothetical protein
MCGDRHDNRLGAAIGAAADTAGALIGAGGSGGPSERRWRRQQVLYPKRF